MPVPKDLLFTREHEWAALDAKTGVVTVGITDYAAEKLGEIVYVELPEEGAAVEREDTFGFVESTKSVSDLFCPVSGSVVETNESLIDSPELINEDPYEEGWMIRIKPSDASELKSLLNAEQYTAYIGELEEEG